MAGFAFFSERDFKQKFPLGCARASGRPLFYDNVSGWYRLSTLGQKHSPPSACLNPPQNYPEMLFLGCFGPELRNLSRKKMFSQPLPGLFLLKFEEFLSKRNTWNKCFFFSPVGKHLVL